MSNTSAARQFVLFIIAGGLAAGVNIGSRLLLGHWLAYVPSILIAYVLGMVTAFALNRQFVFAQAQNRLHQQAFWFVAVNLAAVVQTIVISLLLAHWLLPAFNIQFHNDTLAHVIGVLAPVATSYIGHKHLSFSTSGADRGANGHSV